MSELQTDCTAQITDLVAIKAEQNESYPHAPSPKFQQLIVDLYKNFQIIRPSAQATDSGRLNGLFRETLAAVYP